MGEVPWWLLPYLWKLQLRSKTEPSMKEGKNGTKKSFPRRIWEKMTRSCRKPPPENWKVKIGVRAKASNTITTSNYTLFNFVPKFLFLQFKQFANLLFLVLCIIQAFPNLSPFGLQATLAPLTFIISCSAIREIYEEFRRRVRDRRVNHQLVWANTKKGWQKVRWCRLHPGQVVRVEEGDQLPADVLFISSSEPGGVGYIETANLDGESSLKVRQALGQTSNLRTDEVVEELWQKGGEIVCDLPNKDIYKFTGYFQISDGKKFPLSTANLLLRGARLKNTDFIYGIIVYSGKDTKLKMNNTKRTIKRSRVAHMMNAVMLFQFGICILLSLVAAYFHVYGSPRNFAVFVFGKFEKNPIAFVFLGCLMLFNGLVPISLYVTLEMVQVAQGLFIRADKEMFDKKKEIGADVKMFSLNSELGEVKYVMTDKTGTLTQNHMRFKQCSIGGVKYANKKNHSSKVFKTRRLLEHLQSNEKDNSEFIREFLTSCAVCHTVNTDKHSTDNDRPLYHATSPDESALVNFAADAGFVFHSRVHPDNLIRVKVVDEMKEFTLLHLFEFSSERKRMSVVVRKADGTIRLYVKGADHMILARLAPNGAHHLKRTKSHLHNFATAGFRTLCFAARTVSQEEWQKMKPRLDASAVEVNNQGLFAELAEQMEVDLELIGISAIEDRLQEDVPETIERMLGSGMRVWILTGDKLETAVNIGNSCRLLNPKTPRMVLAFATAQETKENLEKMLQSVADKLNERLRLALIVDATSLDFLLDDPVLQMKFLRLAMCSSAVICCRCTPLQKAAVTRLVKKNADGAVLAVGDGANDVAMIQEADVGVGIAGEEGMQAALAADYSIAQFRFLDRLLFVHGTLSLFRTSKCILYSIYKNVLETTCLFMFGVLNGWTDQPMADEWTIVRYNIFFTSWPALIIGVMDRPAGVEFFKKYSQMYTLYQNPLNMTSQLQWFLIGLLHGFIVFLSISFFYISGAPLSPYTGRDDCIQLFGILIYLLLVIIANLKAVVETSSITVVCVASAIGSVLLYIVALMWDAYAWQFIPIQSPQLADLIWHTPWPGTFFLLLLVCTAILLPDLTVKVVRHSVYKDVRDVILWKEGVRGPNFAALYLPIFKICDTVGLRPQQVESGGNGFAFAQDDGQVLSQMQLISGRFDQNEQPTTSRKKTTEERTNTSQTHSLSKQTTTE